MEKILLSNFLRFLDPFMYIKLYDVMGEDKNNVDDPVYWEGTVRDTPWTIVDNVYVMTDSKSDLKPVMLRNGYLELWIIESDLL